MHSACADAEGLRHARPPPPPPTDRRPPTAGKCSCSCENRSPFVRWYGRYSNFEICPHFHSEIFPQFHKFASILPLFRNHLHISTHFRYYKNCLVLGKFWFWNVSSFAFRNLSVVPETCLNSKSTALPQICLNCEICLRFHSKIYPHFRKF